MRQALSLVYIFAYIITIMLRYIIITGVRNAPSFGYFMFCTLRAADLHEYFGGEIESQADVAIVAAGSLLLAQQTYPTVRQVVRSSYQNEFFKLNFAKIYPDGWGDFLLAQFYYEQGKTQKTFSSLIKAINRYRARNPHAKKYPEWYQNASCKLLGLQGDYLENHLLKYKNQQSEENLSPIEGLFNAIIKTRASVSYSKEALEHIKDHRLKACKDLLDSNLKEVRLCLFSAGKILYQRVKSSESSGDLLQSNLDAELLLPLLGSLYSDELSADFRESVSKYLIDIHHGSYRQWCDEHRNSLKQPDFCCTRISLMEKTTPFFADDLEVAEQGLAEIKSRLEHVTCSQQDQQDISALVIQAEEYFGQIESKFSNFTNIFLGNM